VVKEPLNPNIGNVVWSGFMTRSRSHKVGVDATLVRGHADFLSTIYHLNITHRITFEEVKKYEILGVVTLENSVELD